MSDKVPPPLDLSGVSDVAGSESGGGDGGDGHSGNIEASGNVEVVAGSATPKLPDSSSMPPDTPSRLLTPPVFKPKMDTAKAIAILGFSSSRSLMGDDTKVELSNAVAKQMIFLEKKARRTRQPPTADKQKDDVRKLHEAYQFLSKKYLARKAKAGYDENEASNAAMNAMMSGGTPNAFNFGPSIDEEPKKEEPEKAEKEVEKEEESTNLKNEDGKVAGEEKSEDTNDDDKNSEDANDGENKEKEKVMDITEPKTKAKWTKRRTTSSAKKKKKKKKGEASAGEEIKEDTIKIDAAAEVAESENSSGVEDDALEGLHFDNAEAEAEAEAYLASLNMNEDLDVRKDIEDDPKENLNLEEMMLDLSWYYKEEEIKEKADDNKG